MIEASRQGPAELPFPVATLLRRARNAKSPKDRHDTAYFAWEVSVRLAVAVRPSGDVSALVRGSLGHWVRAFSARVARLDATALLSAFTLLTEVGTGTASTPRSVTPRLLLDALPAYRNRVIGHGSTREARFYEGAATTLIAGLEAAWTEAVFFPRSARLVFAESVEVDPQGERRARLLELMGPVARILDHQGTPVHEEEMRPRRVYLREGERFRDLHPWVLFREAELREQVWFFNGVARRAKYLDYASGEELRGESLEAAFPGVEEGVFALFDGRREDEVEEADDDPDRFGDYRIIGKLGEGGMGVVYLARQESLDRLVALKMLPSSMMQDPTAVARFGREVAALSRCEHPHVIKILASGEARGIPYYAMEYVEGTDLAHVAQVLSSSEDFAAAVSTASERDRVARAEMFADVPTVPLSPPPTPLRRGKDRYRQLAEAFRDAARGVHHLHEAGVIHRDLKPANLMVAVADRRLVVMDLGLAVVTDATRSITRDKNQVLGTIRYMPPEQLQRNLLQVDHRADVYSLGATFYELLTERPFFDGDTEVRLLEQVLREEPVAPQRANPRIPQDLATIVRKATEKDPKLRYDTAEALAEDLDAYLEGRPIAARPPTVWYLLNLAVARHQGMAATIALALLLAFVGTVVFVTRLDIARDRAEQAAHAEAAARHVARRRLAGLYEEQGRSELLAGHRLKASVYLSAAYQEGSRGPVVRYLLAEACRALDAQRAVLVGHGGPVRLAVFSPDGTRAVTVDSEATARIFDATSGRQLAVLSGHRKPIESVAFSPDGTRVVTASEDETARIWNAASGDLLETLIGHEFRVNTAAFSPDGRRVVTASADRTARIWDAMRGGRPQILNGHEDAVLSASFSSDGRRIVTASRDGTARVWDAVSGDELRMLDGHGGPIRSAVFAPDGTRIVTAGEDATAQIWEVSSGKRLLTLTGHTDTVLCATFGADGSRVVTGSEDQTVRIWDATSGLDLVSLEGHEDGVPIAALSPDGTCVVTVSRDRTARIWDATSGRSLATLSGHGNKVNSAAFRFDGARLLMAGGDGKARILDVTTGPALATLAGHEEGVHSAAFSPDGARVVTASRDNTVRVWDATTGEPLVEFAECEGPVGPSTFGPDGGRVVTASPDETARIWDLRNGRCLARLEGHQKRVLSAALSPDGRRVLTASWDRTARIWDAGSGAPLATLEGHEARVRVAAFSPDGMRVVTASPDKTARIWDVASGDQMAELRGHEGSVLSGGFCPEGTRVVTSSDDGTARIWDAATGRQLVVLGGHEGWVRFASFGPNGTRVLMVTFDPTARIWDARSGAALATLEGHRDSVEFAAISPDGTRVVTVSSDRTARIWEASSGKVLAVLEGHRDTVVFAAFSPDGTRVVTASADRTARIWDVHLETRGPAEIAELVRRRSPYRLDEQGLLVSSRPGGDDG